VIADGDRRPKDSSYLIGGERVDIYVHGKRKPCTCGRQVPNEPLQTPANLLSHGQTRAAQPSPDEGGPISRSSSARAGFALNATYST